MMRALCLAASGLATAALAWGYRENGNMAVALALLLFGVLWLVAQWRWPRPGLRPLVVPSNANFGVRVWFSALGLVLTAAAAAAGLLLGAPSGWMIVGALGGLLAWDLTDLDRRLRFAAPVPDVTRRSPSHAGPTKIPVRGLAAGDAGLSGDGSPADDVSTIRRRHLAWLGLTAGAGLLLTTAAMLIPLHFSFALTVLLTLAAVLGMTRLVSWLYRG